MSDSEYSNHQRHRPFSNKNYTYTESELDEMGEILLESERIKSDPKIFRMVQEHLDGKSKEIKSIQDLRDKIAGGYGK